MSKLNSHFIQELAAIGQPYPRLKWYLSAVVALGAFNYPEEIGPLYTRLLESYIRPEDQYEETRKIKEALTKVCGIQGAAKTGSAVRALYEATPEHLIDNTCYREDDDPAVAFPRGEEFVKSIYRHNPDINTNEDYVRKCSPDYFLIVSKYFYPYIFSFDKILNTLESSQAIVSSLIAIDCKSQARNQMKGMMYNGATREEVTMIREVVISIAQKLGIQFKEGVMITVPDIA